MQKKMTTDKNWDNVLDESSHKIVGEIQLREYGKFLDEYANQLRSIEDALDNTVDDSWDMTLDPISLQFSSYERTTLFELIETDNKVLNKVLIALAGLCCEMDFLKNEAQTKYFNPLLFYGEGEEAHNDGESQLYLSRMLHLLQELDCYVKHCWEVARNTVQQLATLYNSSKTVPSVIDVSDVHLQLVFEHLADLLTTLVTLDAIIENQVTLQEHWTQYKRMIKSIRHDPGRFSTSVEKLKRFEDILVLLEESLLSGKIFLGCIEQTFDNGKGFVTRNSAFLEEFTLTFRNVLGELEGKGQNHIGVENHLRYVSVCTLFVLHYHLFQSVDKKLFRQLWDIHKQIPAVTLIGNVLWLPEQFLLSTLPQVVRTLDKKVRQAVGVTRQSYLQHMTQNLPKKAQAYYLQVSSWMIRMESSLHLDTDRLKLDDLHERCSLFLQGLLCACGLSNYIKTVMNLHVALAKPMTKTAVLSLCRLLELLKSIHCTFYRFSMAIAKSVGHIVQHLSYLALIRINNAKKVLLDDKKFNDRKLDVLSALIQAEKALNGPGTRERMLILRLSLAMAMQSKLFPDEELHTFSAILRRLDTICALQRKVRLACDCAFFYWHRVVLPVYFADLYANKTDVRRLHCIFAALRDCVGPILETKHTSSPQVFLDTFVNSISDVLKQQIIDPLCHDVETDLRLNVHSHLQLDDRNPFRVSVKDLSPFFKIRPIRLFDHYVDIKACVERYLEKTFYNLTTVTLYDWRTYGEMRSLAKHMYNLNTVEDYLPSQTLEQGLDVLEIMRNIHIFVSKYLYNLNNQIFVEQSSNNKHLNTINIRHVANSIRTHGTGIMSTTVNFTYQFLRKKFVMFSQFMFDDHIKSRLLKDLRYFREVKDQTNQKYPYERAEKFNKGIRKLGMTPDGKSYLDRFRALISQIGNAMGYVRMIRSGGLHCCANAIRFIPDLEDIVNFEELCKAENLSEECQEAAKQLDQVVSTLGKNFANGTEYFKLLVGVFAPTFQDAKNQHLKNFYIIVPPLTINFVEHIIACKESMNKKNKVGAAFTDDGFAMGVAYILKLLNQYSEFDSLHWFQSVSDKFKLERQQIERQRSSAAKSDAKLQQTMTFTANRLDMYQQEFELLYYSLSSARIFFRGDGNTTEQAEAAQKKDSS